ncbi:MAG: phosphodiester glycosidase family protein [Pseudomonadota bacterium]
MAQFWDFLASIVCALFGTCGQSDCRTVIHANAAHTVCSFKTAEVTVRTHLKSKDGTPYRRLQVLEKSLSEAPEDKPKKDRQTPAPEPVMLMNGGMYHSDLGPVGLYIESEKRIKPISSKGGWGNFHLLPNGVFWMKDRRVGVTETKTYLTARTKESAQPDFATQSGPMLVINGKLHPRFLKNSNSLKIRNGVGVSADGKTIHFAISQQAVTFHDFGTLFKNVLKAPNALYLDGTVSAIRAGSISQGGWRELGPMISVTKRPNAARK